MSRLSWVSLGFGVLFGAAFSAAGFNQYNVVHGALLLQNLQPFFAMGASVITAATVLRVLELRGWQTPLGGPLTLRRWSVERKMIVGGLVFGTGWAVTGACPGTITAMLGAGDVIGVAPLAGILAGIALRDMLAERAQRPAPPAPEVAAATS